MMISWYIILITMILLLLTVIYFLKQEEVERIINYSKAMSKYSDVNFRDEEMHDWARVSKAVRTCGIDVGFKQIKEEKMKGLANWESSDEKWIGILGKAEKHILNWVNDDIGKRCGFCEEFQTGDSCKGKCPLHGEYCMTSSSVMGKLKYELLKHNWGNVIELSQKMSDKVRDCKSYFEEKFKIEDMVYFYSECHSQNCYCEIKRMEGKRVFGDWFWEDGQFGVWGSMRIEEVKSFIYSRETVKIKDRIASKTDGKEYIVDKINETCMGIRLKNGWGITWAGRFDNYKLLQRNYREEKKEPKSKETEYSKSVSVNTKDYYFKLGDKFKFDCCDGIYVLTMIGRTWDGNLMTIIFVNIKTGWMLERPEKVKFSSLETIAKSEIDKHYKGYEIIEVDIAEKKENCPHCEGTGKKS